VNRSNCLFFVISHLYHDGGYVIIRKSTMGPFPHFMWSKNLTKFEEYTPFQTKTPHWFPPIWFKGYIKEVQV
jgi:hypothetical protein